MRILTTGSRTWDDRASIWRILDGIAPKTGPVHVIHGDCRNRDGEPLGADRWVQEWAENRAQQGHPTTWQKFPATARYGPWPARGPRRNAAMVKFFKSTRGRGDKCIAFIRDPKRSPGTTGCVEMIRKAGMFCNTRYYDEEVSKRVDTSDLGNGLRRDGDRASEADRCAA